MHIETQDAPELAASAPEQIVAIEGEQKIRTETLGMLGGRNAVIEA